MEARLAWEDVKEVNSADNRGASSRRRTWRRTAPSPLTIPRARSRREDGRLLQAVQGKWPQAREDEESCDGDQGHTNNGPTIERLARQCGDAGGARGRKEVGGEEGRGQRGGQAGLGDGGGDCVERQQHVDHEQFVRRVLDEGR